ncbi:MAG TPA: ferritin family protein [Desulfobacter postgatei]|jgi:rubrerythrin|uniref:ferritin family protein n=1 Tax=Desulfobacter sp. TaxID=2294 RepID=UPI000E9B559A|nr:ferritin family protein [Desulfobacter sp.]MBP8830367.1 ferritin family protein [Desulfobacter sp.]MBP9598457.1 ferritin family protein [Desulfobacter sp.]HBT89605.1 rubrerythrin [Desulfobacter sp.]HRF89376.1 ferritin family protein [Desulfobacter postgatei]
MFTLNDLFDIAIKMEENGRSVYLNALKQTHNSEIESLVQWMADEEKRHKSWFQEQKGRLSAGSRDLDVMLPGVIKEMMGENSLSLSELDFSKITTPVKMLQTFIMFENDTILFYQFLEAFVESESVKDGLHEIIAEETAHVDKISEMIQSFKAAGEL